MKKTLIALLLSISLFAMCGCESELERARREYEEANQRAIEAREKARDAKEKEEALESLINILKNH